jgi:multidrug resistance efflux pump
VQTLNAVDKEALATLSDDDFAAELEKLEKIMQQARKETTQMLENVQNG